MSLLLNTLSHAHYRTRYTQLANPSTFTRNRSTHLTRSRHTPSLSNRISLLTTIRHETSLSSRRSAEKSVRSLDIISVF